MSRLNCSRCCCRVPPCHSLPLNFCARPLFFQPSHPLGACPRCERCLDFILFWRFRGSTPTCGGCSCVLLHYGVLWLISCLMRCSKIPACPRLVLIFLKFLQFRSLDMHPFGVPRGASAFCLFLRFVVYQLGCVRFRLKCQRTSFIKLLQNRPSSAAAHGTDGCSPTCPCSSQYLLCTGVFGRMKFTGCFDALLRPVRRLQASPQAFRPKTIQTSNHSASFTASLPRREDSPTAPATREVLGGVFRTTDGCC